MPKKKRIKFPPGVIKVGNLEIPDVIYERTTGKKIDMVQLVSEIHYQYRDMYDIISQQILYNVVILPYIFKRVSVMTKNWYVNEKNMRIPMAAWMRYMHTGERKFTMYELKPYTMNHWPRNLRKSLPALVKGRFAARTGYREYELSDEGIRVIQLILQEARDEYIKFNEVIKLKTTDNQWQDKLFWGK